MARRLFKSWFIDFDPVRAKAAVRHEPPKLSNAELSRRALAKAAPDVGGLFPDSFEDSSIGPIPQGWTGASVADAIEINPRRTISKGITIMWLDMLNMPTHSARATTWEQREFKSGTKFENNDTLVARIKPCLENGKTAFVDFLAVGEKAAGSTEATASTDVRLLSRPKPRLSSALNRKHDRYVRSSTRACRLHSWLRAWQASQSHRDRSQAGRVAVCRLGHIGEGSAATISGTRQKSSVTNTSHSGRISYAFLIYWTSREA